MTGTTTTPLLAQEVTCPRDEHGEPRVFVSSAGAYVRDTYGRDWIDFDNAKGSVFLGHGDPHVAEAVDRVARGAGVATGWHPLLDTVLERLATLCGGAAIGLFRTGTAAVRAAACALREVRPEHLLLSAGYHGYDAMWRPAPQEFVPNADGVVDFRYDLEVLAEWLTAPTRVAAIVVSPDHLHLDPGWYERLFELSAAADVPILADEVKTGMRYGTGLSVPWPAGTVWAVAKALANGHPIAAVGGDSGLLEPLRECSFTTFFEPTVLAAADATLERVATGRPQQVMAEQGDVFIDGARKTLAVAELPIEIAGYGPLFQFICANEEVERDFFAATARNGLLFYERDNQSPSAAFDAVVVTEAVRRLDAACADLSGRWASLRVDEWSRYAAAWWVMDGLADLPRTRQRTVAIATRLREM